LFHVLSARARGPIGVDADIGVVDLHVDRRPRPSGATLDLSEAGVACAAEESKGEIRIQTMDGLASRGEQPRRRCHRGTTKVADFSPASSLPVRLPSSPP